MEIPADIKLTVSWVPGSVFYFKEDSFTSSDNAHYFVVLDSDPTIEEVVILSCASSQIQKVKERRKFEDQITLVEVSPEDYKEFSVPTIFDCNSIIEQSFGSLAEKLENQQLKICEKISEPLLNKLRKATLASKMVETNLKKKIDPSFS